MQDVWSEAETDSVVASLFAVVFFSGDGGVADHALGARCLFLPASVRRHGTGKGVPFNLGGAVIVSWCTLSATTIDDECARQELS